MQGTASPSTSPPSGLRLRTREELRSPVGVVSVVLIILGLLLMLLGGILGIVLGVVLWIVAVVLVNPARRRASARSPGAGSAAPPPPGPAPMATPSFAPATVPVPAVSTGPGGPVAPSAVPYCTHCGAPTTFIPQYDRYYCYPCRQYA